MKQKASNPQPKGSIQGMPVPWQPLSCTSRLRNHNLCPTSASFAWLPAPWPLRPVCVATLSSPNVENPIRDRRRHCALSLDLGNSKSPQLIDLRHRLCFPRLPRAVALHAAMERVQWRGTTERAGHHRHAVTPQAAHALDAADAGLVRNDAAPVGRCDYHCAGSRDGWRGRRIRPEERVNVRLTVRHVLGEASPLCLDEGACRHGAVAPTTTSGAPWGGL